MTIDSFLDKIEGKEKSELIQIIKSDLDVLSNAADEIENMSNGDMTKDEILKADGCFGMFISVACFADGRIDVAEYEFAKDLFSYLGYELEDIDSFRETAQSIVQGGYLNKAIVATAGWCKLVEDSENVVSALVEMCACIFACNGAIDSKEIDFLNTLIYVCENNADDEEEYEDDEDDEINTGYLSQDSFSESSVNRMPDQQPILLNHEATVTRDDDSYYFSVGAEIKNPNEDRVACNTAVKILVKDANGRILESYNDTIYCIDSNAIFYYGVEMHIDNGVPTNYQMQVCSDSFVDGPENSTIANGITFSHYSTNRDRWGNTTFTSNVHNSYDKKLRVNAYFVFYNKSGKIVGGTQGWVGELFPNSDDSFESYLRTSADRSSVKASADFNFFDLL